MYTISKTIPIIIEDNSPDQVEEIRNAAFSSDGIMSGSFADIPIYYQSLKRNNNNNNSSLQQFHSSVHCIGDNFAPSSESWKYKTCQFRNLCFDTQINDFVIFTSKEQEELEKIASNPNLTNAAISTGMSDANGVSIGGLNPKWGRHVAKMKWFPKVLKASDVLYGNDTVSTGIYELPEDVVMVPFHSFAGFNVGHLIWDDFLPLYTILTTFDLLHSDHVENKEGMKNYTKDVKRRKNKPLFIRYVLEEILWASCEKNIERCYNMMDKFLPLLIGNDGFALNMSTSVETNVNNSEHEEIKKGIRLWTTQKYDLSLHADHNGGIALSRFVCAKMGASGFGMLTDHGMKKHGWEPKDYETTHNLNRAESLYNFRNFMMNNIGVSTASLSQQIYNERSSPKQHTIVFSIDSSSIGNRRTRFFSHINRLKQSEVNEKYDIKIMKVQMAEMSMVEQIKLISSASIFITVNGGGAVISMFLPKGASLFMYYNDEEGRDNTPARLDWDLINQLGYIRTHWLPRFKKTGAMKGSKTGPLDVDFDVFERLIDHELDIISHL